MNKSAKQVPTAKKGKIYRPGDAPTSNIQDGVMISSDSIYGDVITAVFTKKNLDNFISNVDSNDIKISIDETIDCEITKVEDFKEKYLYTFGEILWSDGTYTIIKKENCYFYFQISARSGIQTFTTMYVMVMSSSIENTKNGMKEWKEYIKEMLPNDIHPKIYFDWYVKVDGKTQEYNITEMIDDTFHNECYPYIDIENVISEYINSQSPILLLMGPPGTGKTRLIRHILRRLDETKHITNNIITRCLFTSSKDIIDEGHIFTSLLLNDSYRCAVLEDIDYHLSARKDGNTSLYTLLSVSNGVMSNCINNKKIILSTNLPNVNNIDEAIIRPGRCFDIIETRKLTYDEAVVCANAIGKDITTNQKSYSIAEIYNGKDECNCD